MDFARVGSLESMMKNRGYYLKLNFKTAERDFGISFGVESSAAPPIFNLYEVFT